MKHILLLAVALKFAVMDEESLAQGVKTAPKSSPGVSSKRSPGGNNSPAPASGSSSSPPRGGKKSGSTAQGKGGPPASNGSVSTMHSGYNGASLFDKKVSSPSLLGPRPDFSDRFGLGVNTSMNSKSPSLAGSRVDPLRKYRSALNENNGNWQSSVSSCTNVGGLSYSGGYCVSMNGDISVTGSYGIVCGSLGANFVDFHSSKVQFCMALCVASGSEGVCINGSGEISENRSLAGEIGFFGVKKSIERSWQRPIYQLFDKKSNAVTPASNEFGQQPPGEHEFDFTPTGEALSVPFP